jgi:hypothetical protein
MPITATEVVDTRAQIATTIASGQTTSPEIDLGGTELAGIQLDTTMTGTAMTFQMALVSGGTYQAVQDGSGSAISITIASGKYIGIDPTHFRGVRFIKLVSGSSEAATRNITVIGKAPL